MRLSYIFLILFFQICVLSGQITSQTLPASDRNSYDSKYSEEANFLRLQNYQVACQLIQKIKEKGWILVTAESVSGGNIAAALARSPGSGGVFAGGAVCYKIEAKKQLLAVPDQKEEELYDLQTARDMALGAQKLYQVSFANKVCEEESYFQKPVMAIATTGRAVTYQGKWEGGVFVGVALPNGNVFAAYFPHTFIDSQGKEDVAKTKDEGMLLACYKALVYAMQQIP